jgi:hypothetical protein
MKRVSLVIDKVKLVFLLVKYRFYVLDAIHVAAELSECSRSELAVNETRNYRLIARVLIRRGNFCLIHRKTIQL